MATLEPSDLGRIFESVDTGLIVLDHAARILAWNGWMTAAAGIEGAAATGHSLEELFPGGSTVRISTAVEEALSAGTSSIVTHSLHPTMFPLKTRAGRALLHNVAIQPMGGKPPQCLVQVTDVTVAVEREQVLRARQNARYDAVVESAPDAILTLDARGVIQLVNQAAGREFGYQAGDLVGRPVAMLFEDEQAWAKIWGRVADDARGGGPIELVGRRKNGAPSFLEISAARWRAQSRIFVTAILRDVNERHAAEAALRALNQTLEHRVAERTADRDRMWKLSADVMLVARLDGRITATNPAWKELLGWDEAMLHGVDLASFVVEQDRPKLEEALHSLAAGPTTCLLELGTRAQDGRIRTIAWSAVSSGEVLQAVGRDVTTEREAELALRQAEESLRQSQKMEAIGQLTGGIAHDFNNLLTGIMGSLDILRRRITAKRFGEVETFIHAAEVSAERAAALTHRLLAFARRQPLDPRALDVNRLVEGMRDLLRRSLGEQIHLDIVLDPEPWPTQTDANQLENALLNLAINGRDAMPSGGRLTIATCNLSVPATANAGADDLRPGDYMLISVADSGAGMAPEVVARAFDPFFTTKPLGEGTGLGLSMVYGFIRQSRGHVQIVSAPGAGTTVKLYLPRHYGPLAAPAELPPGDPPRGSGERVLLVEDDPSVRLLIAEVLRELGYACVEAHDGRAAVPILISNARIDLMITDVGLPGLDGRKLADIGRTHRPELKVLFVTGYAQHATTRESFLGPDTEMLTKPFTLDALATRIRSMLGAVAP